jgi:hypothetical protein
VSFSIYRSINQSNHRPVNPSTSQAAKQPSNQATNQSIPNKQNEALTLKYLPETLTPRP